MSRETPDLVVRWSKRENSLLYVYQNNASKALGGILSGVFERILIGDMNGDLCGPECKHNGLSYKIRLRQPPDPADKRTLLQELDARGFDITTLRISIRRKEPPP